ncbi:interleukin-1 receptor-associated kinase 1-binding protein 1 homolog [Odontesthes bonariensis]|uniref:interleukin-1 receptor-associated kinase 1-binding protein 1 homolog n=1 Tax=Odontesthes bonariensis TaxID=219752 RepID=UPI003F5849BD
MNNPSRVFAAIPPAVGREFSGNEKEQGMEVRTVNRESSRNRLREVQVTGAAEVSCPADRVSVRVVVGNSKESVNDVTNSVSRRLEYISQTLRQHGVGDEDTSVRRFLHRDADMYRMDAEVVVAFSDFEKMEQMRSVLLEKLDKSVGVGTPRFYHSPECLSRLRQRACVLAVENAQQKASKVSQLLGQNLGSPLLVREEETTERRDGEEEEEEGAGREQGSAHFPHMPTVTASSQVSVSFSFTDRSRKKL